jgi:hypothetical protein
VASLGRDDPKLCWIFRDIGFKDWETESANCPRVLWLFGPHDHMEALPQIVSLTREKSAEELASNHQINLFSCRGSLVFETFAYAFLRHILNGSEDGQAKLIATEFLSTLLHKILQRDEARFQEEDVPITTAKKILDASENELLNALDEIIPTIKEVWEGSIVIHGTHKLGPEAARIINTYCSHITNIAPEFRALITSGVAPEIRGMIADEVLCIQHNEERTGLVALYPLA